MNDEPEFEDFLDEGERGWYESEFLLADLDPLLDESRRLRVERSQTQAPPETDAQAQP